MSQELTQLTALLNRAREGDQRAIDSLLPIVYEQLKLLAHNRLRAERAHHTLNTTALVHEAYLKLVGQQDGVYQNRAHFLAIASQAMRRVLIDYARARRAEKRGGQAEFVTFNEEVHGGDMPLEGLIALDAALTELADLDPRQAKIVEYIYFGGMTYDEIGELLTIAAVTVGREWRSARAWLSRRLRN